VDLKDRVAAQISGGGPRHGRGSRLSSSGAGRRWHQNESPVTVEPSGSHPRSVPLEYV